MPADAPALKMEGYVRALEYLLDNPDACTDDAVRAFMRLIKRRMAAIEEESAAGQRKLEGAG